MFLKEIYMYTPFVSKYLTTCKMFRRLITISFDHAYLKICYEKLRMSVLCFLISLLHEFLSQSVFIFFCRKFSCTLKIWWYTSLIVSLVILGFLFVLPTRPWMIWYPTKEMERILTSMKRLFFVWGFVSFDEL